MALALALFQRCLLISIISLLPGNVFSVTGKNFSGSSLKTRSRLDQLSATTRADITVVDWEAARWLDDGFHAALLSFGKIRIRSAGVFYVYSTFAFYAAGTKCSYELRWGKDVAERKTCFVDMGQTTSGTTTTTTISSTSIYNWRKCSLGFLIHLESGSEIELVYKHRDSCRTEEASFKKALPLSSVGLFKVD